MSPVGGCIYFLLHTYLSQLRYLTFSSNVTRLQRYIPIMRERQLGLALDPRVYLESIYNW